MNVTKSGAAAAAEPISVDVTSADNSVVITKTEENKKTSFDLSVTKEKPVEVVGSDPKINVTKVSDIPSATYFLLSLNNVFSKEETAAKIDEKLVGLYKVKGSATLDEIKAKHAEIGDVYNCTTEGELNGEPVYPGDNIVAVSQTEHGLCNWDNLHGSISVASPSVEITSSKNTIAITKTEGADNKVTFDLDCTGASPEGDFITKSGSFFYDTFSRERRTTEKEYDGTVYQPTVGEKSICISSDVEHGSIVSGANSHVEGDDNIVTGEKSFVVGDTNAVFSDRASVLGEMNKVTEVSNYALVSGYGNTVEHGRYSTVLGSNNKVLGSSVVLGSANDISKDAYALVIGSDNTISSDTHNIGNLVIGVSNHDISGANSFLLGGLNESNRFDEGFLIGDKNKNNTIFEHGSLIGGSNENNLVGDECIIIGNRNCNNQIRSGNSIIIGTECNGFTEGDLHGIALGSTAQPNQLNPSFPLCLAIGNGVGGNCIAADQDSVKLYGNVLFDVDGVQYSMKQIVEMLNGQTSSLIYMKTVGYDQNEYKKLFNSMKNNHKIIKNVIISHISDDAYAELYVIGWQVNKDSEGNYDSIKFFTNSGTYVLWSDGSFEKKQLPLP